jgi:3-oxoacyl-[acyl-carrier-protein] synthase II
VGNVVAAPGAEHGARDVIVTGMGFCLPGLSGPVYTASDLWEIASRGASCLMSDHPDGIPYAPVRLSGAEFERRMPDIPGVFSRHFTDAHRFGLLSLDMACADAKLDYRAGDVTSAAILTGRAGIDANLAIYNATMQADFATMTPAEAIELFIGGMQAGTLSDVTLVQAALTRATGPCFTVSCGCCSSAAQIGNAAMMISSGAVDLAIVTGVDTMDADVVNKGQELLALLRRASDVDPAIGELKLPPSFSQRMRPYDRREECSNFGEGAATLILESRAHADARGARGYGRILAHAIARDGLPHPLTSDETGLGLANAIRRCLADRWSTDQIGYIHGASDGALQTTAIEAAAVRELYGPSGGGLVMTSQEACFGHNGSPSGCLGVALITLMMANGLVCPTANCEEPTPGLPFDPVPGTVARPLDFSYALNLTYQMGGLKSVILVGRPDVP